jgi:uncharacterized protein YjbI with pentapeptide repeats
MKPELDRSLVGRDLRNKDLRYYDFRNKILFGVDLRDSRLYGSSITLECQTFDGVKLDNRQVAMLLMMLAQADIDPNLKSELLKAAEFSIGSDAFQVLQRVLRII